MTVLLVVLGLFFVYLIVSQYMQQSSRIKEGATGAKVVATSDAEIKAMINQNSKIKAEKPGLKLTKSYQADATLQPDPSTLTYFGLTFADFYKVTSVKKVSNGLYSCLLPFTTKPITVSDTRLYNDLGTNKPKTSGSTSATGGVKKPAASTSAAATGKKPAASTSAAATGGVKKPAASTSAAATGGVKKPSGSTSAAATGGGSKAKVTPASKHVLMNFKSP